MASLHSARDPDPMTAAIKIVEEGHRRGAGARPQAARPSRQPTSDVEAAGLIRSTTRGVLMRTFNIVIERDPDTDLYVGYVPGWPGAHSQGQTLDELRSNLEEVIGMLLEDGEPKLESEFVGVQTIQVAWCPARCRSSNHARSPRCLNASGSSKSVSVDRIASTGTLTGAAPRCRFMEAETFRRHCSERSRAISA